MNTFYPACLVLGLSAALFTPRLSAQPMEVQTWMSRYATAWSTVVEANSDEEEIRRASEVLARYGEAVPVSWEEVASKLRRKSLVASRKLDWLDRVRRLEDFVSLSPRDMLRIAQVKKLSADLDDAMTKLGEGSLKERLPIKRRLEQLQRVAAASDSQG